MGDFDRFKTGFQTRRPIDQFPPPDPGLKQRPDYARAYDQWHAAIDMWRKTLQDQLDQLWRLEERIVGLESDASASGVLAELNNYKQMASQQIAGIQSQITALESAIASIPEPSSGSGVTYLGVLARTCGS